MATAPPRRTTAPLVDPRTPPATASPTTMASVARTATARRTTQATRRTTQATTLAVRVITAAPRPATEAALATAAAPVTAAALPPATEQRRHPMEARWAATAAMAPVAILDTVPRVIAASASDAVVVLASAATAAVVAATAASRPTL